MTSLFKQTIGTWLSGPLPSKMLTFAVIGLLNTVVDLAIFTVAYKLFELPLVLANVLAWLGAVSGSYVMNTMITFRAETGRVLRRKDYVNFVASGILGVIATTTTLVILSNYVSVLTAKLVSILASFIVNFAMSHFVVFRPKDSAEPPSST